MNTWPMQNFPVAFPVLLTITGISESLFLGHLLVSLFLLLSLVMMFYLLRQNFDLGISFFVTLSLGLLPGMFLNSMGILSENLYLFLSVLIITVISRAVSRDTLSLTTQVSIGFLLLIFINTRTIGIAMIPAVIIVLIFNRSIAAPVRRGISIAITAVLLLWFGWRQVYSIEGAINYIELIKPSLLKSFFGHETSQAGLKHILLINITNLPYAWSHYINLSVHNPFSPIFALVMLCVAQICVVVRAVTLKLDALYICLYFLILVFWPFPINDRFIHPVVVLLLLQPLLLVAQSKKPAIRKLGLVAYSTSMVLLLAGSIVAHKSLFDRKLWARQNAPQLEYYWDLYHRTDAPDAFMNAKIIDQVFRQAQSINKVIPESSILSSIKPVFIALLSDRTTIPLKTDISIGQQMCNLELKQVDYVFYSQLVSQYTKEELGAENLYRNFIKQRYEVYEDQKHIATLVELDKDALTKELNDSGYDCEIYKLFQAGQG